MAKGQEQVEGRDAGPAADVWALGVVAFELLTGELPFTGDSALSVAVKRLTEPPRSARKLVPEVPLQWEQALAVALARQPEHRHASAGQFVAALTSTSTAPAPARPSRRRWWALAGGALLVPVLLLAAGRAAITLRRPSPSGPATPAFVIAVAPFQASGVEASGEAQLLRELIKRSVLDALHDDPGIDCLNDDSARPPRSASQARAYGKTTEAAVVIWGEAVTLRGETEVQVFVTPVEERDVGEAELRSEPLKTNLATPEPLEARKAKAREIGRLAAAAAGVWHLNRGQSERAIAILDRLETPDARSFELKSSIFEQSGHRMESALALVRSGIARWPTDAGLHARLCAMLLRSDKAAEALPECRKAAELAPSEGRFRRALAQALSATRDDAGAARELAAATPSSPAEIHRTVLGRWFRMQGVVAQHAEAALPVLLRLQSELGQEPFFTKKRGVENAGPYLNGLVPWEASAALGLPPTPGKLKLPEDLVARFTEWQKGWVDHASDVDLTGVDFEWITQVRRFGRWELTPGGALDPLEEVYWPAAPIPNLSVFIPFAKARLLQGMRSGDPASAGQDVEHLAWLAYQSETLVGAMYSAALLGLERLAYESWIASGHPPARWSPPSEALPRNMRRVFWGMFAFGGALAPPALARAALSPMGPGIGRCAALYEMMAFSQTTRRVADKDLASWHAFVEEQVAAPGNCTLPVVKLMGTKRSPPLDRVLLEKLQPDSADEALGAAADDLAKAFLLLVFEKDDRFAMVTQPK